MLRGAGGGEAAPNPNGGHATVVTGESQYVDSPGFGEQPTGSAKEQNDVAGLTDEESAVSNGTWESRYEQAARNIAAGYGTLSSCEAQAGAISKLCGSYQPDIESYLNEGGSEALLATITDDVKAKDISGAVDAIYNTLGYDITPSGKAIPRTAAESGTGPETAGTTTGKKSIVIGEDMEGRVIPTAKKLGAGYYDPPEAPPSQWMENNRQWIQARMAEGCTIYDCGAAPGRSNYPKPTSPYYEMELGEIDAVGYPTIPVEVP